MDKQDKAKQTKVIKVTVTKSIKVEIVSADDKQETACCCPTSCKR